MSQSAPSVVVLGNCTHISIARTLRKSNRFSKVASVEVYTVPQEKRGQTADSLEAFDLVLTLEHGEAFGPLATSALRERFGDRLFSLPTPFFPGTMPDMAYLLLDGKISRAPGILGDYHSGLILTECADGLSEQEVVRRYTDGSAFDRLDVEGVWDDAIAELERRERNTQIQFSDFIRERRQLGLVGEDFLSFNHPREAFINHICGAFARLVLGTDTRLPPLLAHEHNLYHDARWPLHPAVAERLGLPLPSLDTFKTPERLGGEELTVSEFARRSHRFFTSEGPAEKFKINTPSYLTNRIGPRPADGRPFRSPQPMKHPRQIVLTHFGRSGSTVLAKMLEQHPSIFWLHEIFSLCWIRSRETYHFTLDEMTDMVNAAAEKVWAKAPTKHVGHEIKLMNFLQNPGCNMVDYAAAVADPERFRHVVLLRTNTLRRILSVYKAMRTKIYHSSDEQYRKSGVTYSVDFNNLFDPDTGQRADTLEELIRKARAREQSVLENYRKVGVEYLALSYEDDIEQSPAKAYGKVLDWVGLPAKEAEVTLSKTGAPLREELANYDRVEEALRGTEFEWMLE